jgi:hypothetical protein
MGKLLKLTDMDTALGSGVVESGKIGALRDKSLIYVRKLKRYSLDRDSRI